MSAPAAAASPSVERSGARPHVDALDVVRPVTSVGVILTHCVEMFGFGVSALSGAVLAETHATREIFFLVSGLVLVYQSWGRPEWSALAFWRRRLLLIGVPYLVWTLVYFGLSYSGVTGLSISTSWASKPPLQALGHLGVLVVTGTGHLYFVIVLMQLYLLFPAFRWLLRATRGHHGLLVAVSLACQLGYMAAIHFGLTPAAMQGYWAGREIITYQFYLVAGGVGGAHLTEVHRWIWRHRFALAAAVVAVAAATEAGYFLAVHAGGASVGSASDPFAPRFVFFNLAAALGLYLVGAWWAAHQRGGWLSRLIRSTSDNSFGVYLSHAVFLDLVFSVGLLGLQPGAGRLMVALASTWVAASALTVVAARTPLALRLVGRARRPLFGGPPAVGRGTQGATPVRSEVTGRRTAWLAAHRADGRRDRAARSSLGASEPLG